MKKLVVHDTGGTTWRTETGALVFPGIHIVGDTVSAEDAEQIVANGRGEFIEDEPAKSKKVKHDDILS